MSLLPPFSITKFWQGKEPFLVGQVRIPSTKEKIYLYFDTRQLSFGCSLRSVKDDQLSPAGAFVTKLRSIFKSALLTDIRRNPENGNILASFGKRGKAETYLLLEKSRPPVMHLLHPEKSLSLIRLSQRGTFTKKMSLPVFDAEYSEQLSLAMPGSPQQWTPTDQLTENSATGHSSQSEEQKNLMKAIKRRLKSLKKASAKLATPSPSNIEWAKLCADSARDFSYLIKKGHINLHLPSEITGYEHDLNIPLNSEHSPGENINGLYKKLKKLMRTAEKSQEQAGILEVAKKELSTALETLEKDTLSAESLKKLRRTLGLPERQRRHIEDRRPQFADSHFSFIMYGVEFKVGKSAQKNDLLSKSAKGDDHWFHAIGTTGSHVLIRNSPQFKNGLPKPIQRVASILAIYFSKYRKDFRGEVYYTRRSQIKKTKDLAIGAWKVLRSDTLYIQYDEAEINEILGHKKN